MVQSMTKSKIECLMKRLGKMINSELETSIDYDLPERFAPTLLDLGYIEFKCWPQRIPGGFVDCSAYFVTEKGRDSYFEWRDQYYEWRNFK